MSARGREVLWSGRLVLWEVLATVVAVVVVVTVVVVVAVLWF